jgi:transposase
MLMEDGAPIHRSMAARTWRERNDIEVLPWPAQSPDLNPIEHIWKVLKVAVSKRTPPVRTEDELRMALVDEWSKISPDMVSKVVENMPRRVKAVILARGRSTHY